MSSNYIKIELEQNANLQEVFKMLSYLNDNYVETIDNISFEVD